MVTTQGPNPRPAYLSSSRASIKTKHASPFICKAFLYGLVLLLVSGLPQWAKTKCLLTSKVLTSRSSNFPESDIPAQFTSMSTGPSFSCAWKNVSRQALIKRKEESWSNKSMPVNKIYKTIKPIRKFTNSKPHSKIRRTNRKARKLIPISPTSYLFYDILDLAIVLRYVDWYTEHHLLERENNHQSYAGVWKHF